MKIPFTAILCLFASQLSYGLAADSRQEATLIPSKTKGFYKQGEVLRIALPKQLSSESVTELTLELDNIDVSGLASFSVAELAYTPAQRLSPGTHTLRLMRYARDGSVSELGFWQINIRQSAKFRRASINSQLDTSLSQRFADGNDLDESRYSAQASGRFSGLLEQNTWQMQSDATLSYSDKKIHSLTGRKIDIPSFLVSTTAGNYKLQMGDHSLGQSNLLDDGFQRRGISTTVALAALDSSVSVYSISANQRVGLEGGLGVSDKDNRISGAQWQYQPVNNEESQIFLSTHVLSGNLKHEDFGAINFNQVGNAIYDGQAINLSLDGQFLQRQLRFRWERATTLYDFDGKNIGYDAERDHAWTALVHYQPETQNDLAQASPLSWGVGMEVQEVGTFYKSLINVNLPSDKHMMRVFTHGSTNAWYWDANFAVETNNLDKNTDYATSRISTWTLNGGYSDYTQPKPGSVFKIIGQPSYTWSISNVKARDEITPVGFFKNDLVTRNFGTHAIFKHPSWQWSLGYNHDNFDDRSGFQPKTLTRALSLNANKQFNAHYYLGVGWQLQKTLFRASNITTDRQLYSVDARAEFIPDKLSANLSIGINQNDAANDPFFALRDKSTYSSASLQWQIKPAKENSLGMDLSFSLNKNKYINQLNNVINTDDYQAFVTLNTSLPTALPGGV